MLFVVGNWKMNGDCLLVLMFSVLFDSYVVSNVDIVLCLLVVYLLLFFLVNFSLGG